MNQMNAKLKGDQWSDYITYGPRNCMYSWTAWHPNQVISSRLYSPEGSSRLLSEAGSPMFWAGTKPIWGFIFEETMFYQHQLWYSFNLPGRCIMRLRLGIKERQSLCTSQYKIMTTVKSDGLMQWKNRSNWFALAHGQVLEKIKLSYWRSLTPQSSLGEQRLEFSLMETRFLIYSFSSSWLLLSLSFVGPVLEPPLAPLLAV